MKLTPLSINLRRARKEIGLSQREVAEHIGIPRHSLSSYEEARCEPNLLTYYDLCELYNITDTRAFFEDINYFNKITL